MKRLTTYISHVKELHSLNEYLNEKLVVNKNYNPYTCAPASWDELRKIIEDRYDKLGPGTEQKPIDFNDIDVSEMTTFHNVFKGTKFEYINISNWYAPKVEDMSYMFKNCKNLKSIGNLSNWNVSNVKKLSVYLIIVNNWNLLEICLIGMYQILEICNIHFIIVKI